MPSPKLTPLDEAERAELEAWLGEHAESLPAPVRAAQLRAKTSSTFAFAFAAPSISLRFWLAGDVRRVILS